MDLKELFLGKHYYNFENFEPKKDILRSSDAINNFIDSSNFDVDLVGIVVDKLIPTLDEADLKQAGLIDGKSDLFYKGSVLYSRIIDPTHGELYEDLDYIIRLFCDYDLETPYDGHEEDRGLMWQYAHEAFFVFVQHLKEWYVNYLKLKISKIINSSAGEANTINKKSNVCLIQ